MITICETSTSRLYAHLTGNKCYAMISAYTIANNENENKRDFSKLRSDVRNLGLGYIPFVSRWTYRNDSGDLELTDEQSLLILGITKEKAIELGEKYNQESIIYKDDLGCKEICTSNFNTFDGLTMNVGDVVRTFNINKNSTLNIESAKEIFAGRKLGAASRLKKGSKTEFHLKEVWEIIEPIPHCFSTDFRKRIIYSDENLSVADALNELNKLN